MEQFKQKSLEIRYCLFENQIPLWQAVIRVHFFLFPYQFFSYKGINQRRICTIRSSRLRILHIVTINNYNDSCLSVILLDMPIADNQMSDNWWGVSMITWRMCVNTTNTVMIRCKSRCAFYQPEKSVWSNIRINKWRRFYYIKFYMEND